MPGLLVWGPRAGSGADTPSLCGEVEARGRRSAHMQDNGPSAVPATFPFCSQSPQVPTLPPLFGDTYLTRGVTGSTPTAQMRHRPAKETRAAAAPHAQAQARPELKSSAGTQPSSGPWDASEACAQRGPPPGSL